MGNNLDTQRSQIPRQKLIQIQREVTSGISDLGFVDSATLIHGDLEKRRIEHIMDLDTLIITKDKVTPHQYQKLKDVFNSTQQRFTQHNLDVPYAIATGPVKPSSRKDNEIFFHVLLMDEKGYDTSPLRLVQTSWQYETPFVGKPPSNYYTRERITQNMLVNSVMGIKNCEEFIRTNHSFYLGWKDNGSGKMEEVEVPVPLTTPEGKLEIYFYSVLRCASNALRLKFGNNNVGIGKDMCDSFTKAHPESKYSRVPEITHDAKRLLRNRELPTGEDSVRHYQKMALNFLSELKRKYQ